MKPSAPVTMNALFQPNASAIGGISSGVRTAPTFGAVFMSPMPSERSFSGRYVAMLFTAAGVWTDSATASTARAATNCCMDVANACAMPARLHTPTAIM